MGLPDFFFWADRVLAGTAGSIINIVLKIIVAYIFFFMVVCFYGVLNQNSKSSSSIKSIAKVTKKNDPISCG
jgi:fucose 4-O-acetylase-like acetyltransferase